MNERDPYKSVRQSDIAEALGVSTVTVSNALAGRKGVSDELRKKILEEAERLGYSPAVRVRQPQKAQPSPSQLARPVYRFAVCFSEEYAPDSKRAFTDIMRTWPPGSLQPLDSFVPVRLEGSGDEDQVPGFVKRVRDIGADGILTIGPCSREFVSRAMKILGLPWVMIDGNLSLDGGDSLFTDVFRAGYMLTENLHARGHDNVGLLLNPPMDEMALDFCQGFNKALLEHDLSPAGSQVVMLASGGVPRGLIDNEMIYSKTIPVRLLKGPNRMTAWVLSDLSLLRPLSQASRRLPIDDQPDVAVLSNNSTLRLTENSDSWQRETIVSAYLIDRTAMLKHAAMLLRRRVRSRNRERQIMYFTGELQEFKENRRGRML